MNQTELFSNLPEPLRDEIHKRDKVRVKKSKDDCYNCMNKFTCKGGDYVERDENGRCKDFYSIFFTKDKTGMSVVDYVKKLDAEGKLINRRKDIETL